MTSIIIYGNDEKRNNEIIKNLSPFGAIIINKNRICRLGDNFLIINGSDFDFIEDSKGIVIFISPNGLNNDIVIPKSFVAITESDNQTALSILLNNETKTITCGMSSTDTLTLSSISDDTRTICLQRELETLSGKTVEPFEFSIKNCFSTDEFGLLAARAVLLLSEYDNYN